MPAATVNDVSHRQSRIEHWILVGEPESANSFDPIVTAPTDT